MELSHTETFCHRGGNRQTPLTILYKAQFYLKVYLLVKMLSKLSHKKLVVSVVMFLLEGELHYCTSKEFLQGLFLIFPYSSAFPFL